MNLSIFLLAMLLGLSVFSLIDSLGEVCRWIWKRCKSRIATRQPEGPFTARAHQGSVPVIGVLSSGSADNSAHLVNAFHRGLAENGYVEGQNLTVEYRWAEGIYDRLPAMAVELARMPLTLLVSLGEEPTAMVAKAATSTIPIVADLGVDPVASGLVARVSRPRRNITGISCRTATLEPERLGLLQELMPRGGLLQELMPHGPTVGVLVNSDKLTPANQTRELWEVARAVDMQLHILRASTDDDIDAAFDSIKQNRIPVLAVASDAFFNTRRDKLVALAADNAVPAMYSSREYAEIGGLMSYGINPSDVCHRVGIHAGGILNGAKPCDLPVMQPTKFELVINLQTARSLKLEIPATLLARADELIE